MTFIDSRTNNFFFNFNINLGGQQSLVNCNPMDGANALSLLNSFFGMDRMGPGGQPFQTQGMPGCGCMPRPNINQSGAPAGQGLQKNEDGSITTAGGYKIQPEGKDAAWKIFGPDGKELTRVWGDPHVNEADGTRWDFTKSSDFVLPDGTRIHAKTNYDPSKGNGQSVTTGLEITNGADRASVSGIDGNRPQTTLSQDGYEWRALHLSQNPGMDNFYLGGDGKNVHWTRERNGQIDGVITGATQVDAGGHKIYDQQVDRTLRAGVDPSLRPALGSPAWGNMIRGELNDAQAKAWGQALGPFGAFPALQNAYAMHGDHIQSQFMTELSQLLFGGWAGVFPNYGSPFDALSGMTDLLRSESQWRNQFRTGQVGQTTWV